MKKRHQFLIAFLGVSAAWGDVPSGNVTIESFRYHGTGCKEGSVATLLSPDLQALTLIFNEFVADTAENPPRRFCDIKLRLQAPSGWRFSLFSVDYRGYAHLEAGVTGEHSARYRVGNSGWTSVGTMAIRGPFDDDYVRSFTASVGSLPKSHCLPKQDLFFRTELSATPTKKGPKWERANGLMTVDSIDGSLTERFGIHWQRCG